MLFEVPLTAQEIGERCGAAVSGDPGITVDTFAALSDAKPRSLSFLSDRAMLGELDRLNEVVILTRQEFVRPREGITFLTVDEPRSVFFRFLSEFGGRRRNVSDAAIDSSASISLSAEIGRGVQIGPRSIIGDRVIIHDSVSIGADVFIGSDSEVFSRCVLGDAIRIGERVKVLSGAIIGSDGFGFLPSSNGYREIPQMGSVIIEDDVRVGANCTIDRGTLGNTRIGQGTKLDNLVHVGHNCVVGRNCILCAQVGLGGSTVLEDDVILGGQVGLGDHVRVGKGARMGGQSGSSTNVRGGETYFLTPAIPIKEVLRLVKAWRKLPQLLSRVRTLENTGGIK